MKSTYNSIIYSEEKDDSVGELTPAMCPRYVHKLHKRRKNKKKIGAFGVNYLQHSTSGSKGTTGKLHKLPDISSPNRVLCSRNMATIDGSLSERMILQGESKKQGNNSLIIKTRASPRRLIFSRDDTEGKRKRILKNSQNSSNIAGITPGELSSNMHEKRLPIPHTSKVRLGKELYAVNIKQIKENREELMDSLAPSEESNKSLEDRGITVDNMAELVYTNSSKLKSENTESNEYGIKYRGNDLQRVNRGTSGKGSPRIPNQPNSLQNIPPQVIWNSRGKKAVKQQTINNIHAHILNIYNHNMDRAVKGQSHSEREKCFSPDISISRVSAANKLYIIGNEGNSKIVPLSKLGNNIRDGISSIQRSRSTNLYATQTQTFMSKKNTNNNSSRGSTNTPEDIRGYIWEGGEHPKNKSPPVAPNKSPPPFPMYSMNIRSRNTKLGNLNTEARINIVATKKYRSITGENKYHMLTTSNTKSHLKGVDIIERGDVQNVIGVNAHPNKHLNRPYSRSKLNKSGDERDVNQVREIARQLIKEYKWRGDFNKGGRHLQCPLLDRGTGNGNGNRAHIGTVPIIKQRKHKLFPDLIKVLNLSTTHNNNNTQSPHQLQ